MKKSLFSIIVILCCGLMFSGCTKSGTPTINPSMTAAIASYTFNADYIEPRLQKSQIADTGTTLFIDGYERSSGDKIEITVTKYTGAPGTYSIVQGQASAYYLHNNIRYTATGGIVAIKDASDNVITGYFNFTSASGVTILNGNYVCGKPWVY